MKQVASKTLSVLQSIPRKVILWVLIAGTIVILILNLIAKGTVLKAKERNLAALIQDAVTKLKLKMNKDKIKDLDKKHTTEKDPSKVEEFYKKNLK